MRFFTKNDTFYKINCARTCVYEKVFVPLYAFYGRIDKTYRNCDERER